MLMSNVSLASGGSSDPPSNKKIKRSKGKSVGGKQSSDDDVTPFSSPASTTIQSYSKRLSASSSGKKKSSQKASVPLIVNATNVRMFQHLAAFACYALIVEKTTMNTNNMNKLFVQLFFGTKDEEHKGQIVQIVQGSGIFVDLWQQSNEATKVSEDFVPFISKLADITPGMLSPGDLSSVETNIIGHSTFGSGTMMIGRAIKKKK